jgi:outer membrane protein OmpA-like peptidoglycan-associated protein
MKKSMGLLTMMLVSSVIMAQTADKTPDPQAKQADQAPSPTFEATVNGQQVNPIERPKADVFARNATAATQSRITVYRVGQSPSQGVARVTFNDRYWASLQPNGFAQLCIKPSRFNLQVTWVQDGKPPIPAGPIGARSLNPEVATNHYFRVTDRGAGILQISPVSEAFAMTELGQAQRQVHSVRRVADAQACEEASEFVAAAAPAAAPVVAVPVPVAPPVAKAVAQERFTLGADALFAFGKSDLRSLSSQGRADLDILSQKIQTHQAQLKGSTVLVTGHADPIGKASSNQKLSENRAKTVRAYLIQTGLAPGSISSTGKGSTAPVVKNCGKKASPKTIACNAPNRRVDIDVRFP